MYRTVYVKRTVYIRLLSIALGITNLPCGEVGKSKLHLQTRSDSWKWLIGTTHDLHENLFFRHKTKQCKARNIWQIY